MAWNDTLKSIIDQGSAAAKELADKAAPAAQDILGKAQDFAEKAGAAVQQAGEKGVLTVEIKQLEGQVSKLFARLGAEVYSAWEKGAAISAEDPYIKTSLSEISAVKESIEKKTAELKK